LLLRLEWRRYRADRSPAPPPDPEEAALDRWNAGVVMLVAGLSIVGAVMAFWASGKFSSASDLSQQAVQEVTQYQTVKAEQDGYVDFGARLSEDYQEHTAAESNLYSEAAAAWAAGETTEAAALEADARVEGAQERALVTGFVCYWPSYRGAGGSVVYDVPALRASEVELPCVQPGQDPSALRTLGNAQADALAQTAANNRAEAQQIVLGGAFLIAAVFFLTLSYLGWRHRRARSLASGVVAMAVALGISIVAALA
jgi:Arc/MetJ-type ribon-helix-helix transcriptional regulator